MPLFAIRNDGYEYQELDLTSMDVVNNAPEDIPMADIIGFHRNNTAMQSWWQTPETRFIHNEGTTSGPIPDIRLWSGGANSSLVLSPTAWRLLGELMQPYGEFLPVKADGETCQIFNCLTLAEADETRTSHEYVDGAEFGLKQLAFTEDAESLLLFKTTADACTTLFCNERFKDAVESFNLSGITFDENLIEVFE